MIPDVMTDRPTLFNELDRTTLGKLAPTSLVVLPVGATEQHGPHLATGTDTFAVEHITRAAAALASDSGSIIVAPTLPFGSSDHHLAFGATMSIGTQTYYAVIRDLVASLITDGFRKILVVNGHGGNHELVQLAARDLALLHTEVRITGPRVSSGYALEVLRRQPDGRWLLAIGDPFTIGAALSAAAQATPVHR